MTTHTLEIQQGQRFEFGKNWQRFLSVLNDERIAEAEKSLRAMLETESLSGKSFLDVGSGSGLFSLAAMRLGAARVHSFDYDAQSVACTRELKRRYFPGERIGRLDRAASGRDLIIFNPRVQNLDELRCMSEPNGYTLRDRSNRG